MHVDLFHNQIISAVATKQFERSVHEVLVPLIEAEYADCVGICMYEDHLADGFLSEGEWYYPLTVLSEDGARIAWVKWSVPDKKSFKGGVPYAYVGDEPLAFSLAEDVPAEFLLAMDGRAITYSADSIKIKVHTTASDPLLLVGRYSQSFVDELALQITADISRTMSVSGIAGCTIQLELVFAPDTYMEHTSENVTYRRLLLTDKGCQARDFWVKWTRLDGVVGYSVTDTVNAEVIRFEIGEDVPQKIREKEYRFLCRSNPDKYQSAMGKRTATEWRELIKRLIKHGLIEKVELPIMDTEDDEVTDMLMAVLGEDYEPSGEESADTDSDYDDIAAMARAVLGEDAPTEDTDEYEQTADGETEYEDDTDEDEFVFGLGEPDDIAEDEPQLSEDEPVAPYGQEIPEEEEVEVVEEPLAEEVAEEDNAEPVNDEDERDDEERRREYAELERLREERIRAEVEARVRLEFEAEARAKAEAEAERLRIEHDRLKAENERLLEEARIREEQRAAREAERLREEELRREEERARAEEEERVRARIAEQARLEAEERARLAETARIALEEQKRLDRERAEREARERELAELRERERLEREAEERRIEAQRLAEERRRIEEERAARSAAPKEPTVAYVTKHAKLLFRRPVDVNVIKRIKEIIEDTLVKSHKEHVHIHIKAYPIDSYTINLDIMKIPETEGELLVAIIKAIGNGNIGITKIIVE